jgi:excisionase family DNA binding protein
MPLPELLDSFLDLVVDRLVPPLAAELATTLSQVQSETEPWRLLNVDEAAARLGRSSRWVRERAKRGQLAFVRLDGGALAFELEDVQAFAGARRISAGEPTALAQRLHIGRNPALREGSERPERATDPEVGS